MIELREITKDNLDDVLNLDVSDHQKGYVSSTASSLAQAYVYRATAFPFEYMQIISWLVLLCWDITKRETNILFGSF